MDTHMELQKSLPPLVEGKVHGYLKFVIDEVIWTDRNFGDIGVFVSWWGETNKSLFRPADITRNIITSLENTTEVYAIRTNINLFKEYVKNCEFLELVIVSDQTNLVVGTCQVTDLLEIFDYKPYFRYVPIITNTGNKIGEIHVSMKLECIKSHKMQLKECQRNEKQADENVFSAVKSCHNVATHLYVKPERSEIYKSILKTKRTASQWPANKSSNEVTDKLISEVMAKAKRLRGILQKEASVEDMLPLNYMSINSSINSNIPIDETIPSSPDEYILESDTNYNKLFYKLKQAGSKINLPDSSLKGLECDYNGLSNGEVSSEMKCLFEDFLSEDKSSMNLQVAESEICRLPSYISIHIESLTLTPAGYRRVKSSSSSDNDSALLSATYFVQYEFPFDCFKETEKGSAKQEKSVRICSQSQTIEEINFNHNGTYKITNTKLNSRYCIKFKVFVRHMNRKLFIELGNTIFCVNDALKSESGKVEKQLSLLCKGIKVGMLNVSVEIGLEPNNLLRQHRVRSPKKNFGTIEGHRLNSVRSGRSRPLAKSQHESNDQTLTISMNGMNSSTGDSNAGAKNIVLTNKEGMDYNKVNIKDVDRRMENKVLLHALIHVAEGQDLPELNTYLVCRAFWKEDKMRSQVCNNTQNPFYQFSQLVPLTYDNSLLERVKDNYVVIEVYTRNNNMDNLLGLTKLTLHPLYVAFKDPHVLANLLLSKYPVVSVDDWVPVIDPLTGRSCGQLLALVALGTSEQIAMLEITRGLHHAEMIPQRIGLENITDRLNGRKDLSQLDKECYLQSNVDMCSRNSYQTYVSDKPERDITSPCLETRECQTDISTVREIKCVKNLQEENPTLEHAGSRDTNVHFIEDLNVNNTNVDQWTQTERNVDEMEKMQGQLNAKLFEESDNNSVRNNIDLSTETCRSVGVGAEYDNEFNQFSSSTLPTTLNTDSDSTNSICDQPMFRAIVEIECALHLPKVEKANEAAEPYTYVSFQATKYNGSKHQNAYMLTDVFPRSCNPKWNWKCDTKLPIELLLHEEKRLILKVWRLLDADISAQINLERDIVIGFSAIDLTILTNGFPVLSGWFHIMDFTGRNNGQLKVCVTPLDNLSLLGKSVMTLNPTRMPTLSHPSCSTLYSYGVQPASVERNISNLKPSSVAPEEVQSIQSESQSSDSALRIGFEDVSMSFLSSSLQKKLIELDEITQRLQSRLRDVTNTAFEDDLDNELDLNELHSDSECNNYKMGDLKVSPAIVDNSSETISTGMGNKIKHRQVLSETEVQNPSVEVNCDKNICSKAMENNTTKMLNLYGNQNLIRNNTATQQEAIHLMEDAPTFATSFADYPKRGTKTHINCLLDKLSLQFPTQSYFSRVEKIENSVTRGNYGNNNLNDTERDNLQIKNCTLDSQMDETHNQNSETYGNAVDEEMNRRENRDLSGSIIQSQSGTKMSKIICEELIAEENNDESKYDELSTYLLASNVRHMDLNNIFNPLLYTHLLPDLRCLNSLPEEESAKRLDDQYNKVFTKSVTNSLNCVQNMGMFNVPPEDEVRFKTSAKELEDTDSSSVIALDSGYNILSGKNSSESTTTISTEESLMKTMDLEVIEHCGSGSSEKSVLVLSRQAPDGGNPTEDSKKALVAQEKSDTQYSSSSTCN